MHGIYIQMHKLSSNHVICDTCNYSRLFLMSEKYIQNNETHQADVTMELGLVIIFSAI